MPYTLSPLGSKERLIPRLGTSNPEMLCGVVGKRHKNALWENGAPFRSSLGRGAVAPHPKQKRGAKSPPPPPTHRCIRQYLWHQRLQRAHFLPSELPTNKAGLPEQLPTDILSQIDYGQTRHCEDCSCQRTTQRAFWKIWVGVCVWLSGSRIGSWWKRPWDVLVTLLQVHKLLLLFFLRFCKWSQFLTE